MTDTIITLDSFYDCNQCISSNNETYIWLKKDNPCCPIHGDSHEDSSDSRIEEVLAHIIAMIEADDSNKYIEWLEIATSDVVNRVKIL